MQSTLDITKKKAGTHPPGFTLVELIVVIVIMAISFSLVTMSFKTWQKKSTLESEIRELFTDLQAVRTRAVTQKSAYGVILQPSGYMLRKYATASNYSTGTGAATNGTLVTNKTFRYGLTSAGTTTPFTSANNVIVFETTGMTTVTTPRMIIVVNPVTASPTINCIVVSSAHDNLGRWNASTSNCEIN